MTGRTHALWMAVLAAIGCSVGGIDRGMSAVCWSVNDLAVYVGPGCAAEDAVLPVWQYLPLRITVDTDVDATVVGEAGEVWNAAVGCPTFYVGDGAPDDVSIITGGIMGAVMGEMHMSGSVATGPTHATVVIRQATTARALRLVVTHELGHVLGLDDDTGIDESIMRATLDAATLADDSEVEPQPLDTDVALLRTYYDCAGVVRS